MNTPSPAVSAEASKFEQLCRLFKAGFSDLTYDQVMELSNLFAHAVFSRLKELRLQDTPAQPDVKPVESEISEGVQVERNRLD